MEEVKVLSVIIDGRIEETGVPEIVGKVGISRNGKYFQIGYPLSGIMLTVNEGHKDKGIGTALIAASISHITNSERDPIIQIPVSEDSKDVIEHLLEKLGVKYEYHAPIFDKSGDLLELGYFQITYDHTSNC